MIVWCADTFWLVNVVVLMQDVKNGKELSEKQKELMLLLKNNKDITELENLKWKITMMIDDYHFELRKKMGMLYVWK